MANQILDTELDVARKYLHFSQRDLFKQRFGEFKTFPDEERVIINYCLRKVKYWRMRFNAAMAIQQAREEEISRYDFNLITSIDADERY